VVVVTGVCPGILGAEVFKRGTRAKTVWGPKAEAQCLIGTYFFGVENLAFNGEWQSEDSFVHTNNSKASGDFNAHPPLGAPVSCLDQTHNAGESDNDNG